MNEGYIKLCFSNVYIITPIIPSGHRNGTNKMRTSPCFYKIYYYFEALSHYLSITMK